MISQQNKNELIANRIFDKLMERLFVNGDGYVVEQRSVPKQQMKKLLVKCVTDVLREVNDEA